MLISKRLLMAGSPPEFPDVPGIYNNIQFNNSMQSSHSQVGSPYYGEDVAMSNSYIVIGAKGTTSSTGKINSGAVYIHSMTSYMARLQSPYAPNNENEFFGARVGIDDNYICVSAPYRTNTAQREGCVYVYRTSNYSLVTTIYPSPSQDARCGNSYCKIHDGVLFVSIDMGNTSRMLMYQVGTWNFLGSFMTEGFSHPISVAYNNGILYVNGGYSGYLRWNRVSDGTELGRRQSSQYACVGVSNQYLALGMGAGPYGGSGYVVVWRIEEIANSQNFLRVISPPEQQNNGGFGSSIRFFDHYMIVGARGINNYSGKIYIYDARDMTLFTSFGNPNRYSTPDDDVFGTQIETSSGYFAVTAIGEDSPMIQSYYNWGAVYTYRGVI